MAPLMAEIDHCLTVEEKKRPGSLGKSGAAAQGYGLFNLAYAVGFLIGPLWAGFITQSAGWETMTWSLGLLGGVAAFPVFWWTGGRIMLRGKERAVTAGEAV
jgi:MFS family permease